MRGIVDGETIEAHVDLFETIQTAAPDDYIEADVEREFFDLQVSTPENPRYEAEPFLHEKLASLDAAARHAWFEKADIVETLDIEAIDVSSNA